MTLRGTAVTACTAPGQKPTNRKEADKLPPVKENGINASQNRPVLGESLFMELPPARRLRQIPARAVLVISFLILSGRILFTIPAPGVSLLGHSGAGPAIRPFICRHSTLVV